jgi:hypothetical protein
MSAIKAVAASGRTVMVTIHQPSIDVFESFGSLYLLQKGGWLIYFGPLGHHSQDLVTFFSGAPGKE